MLMLMVGMMVMNNFSFSEGNLFNLAHCDFSPRKIPLITLRLWAENHRSDNDKQLRSIAASLQEMTSAEAHWSWQAMETYHAHWEALRSILLGGQRKDFEELYPGALFSDSALRRRQVSFPKEVYQTQIELPTLTLIGGSNAGFDMIVEHKTTDHHPRLLKIFEEIK